MDNIEKFYRLLCEQMGRERLTEEEILRVVSILQRGGHHAHDAAELPVG